jgi:DNA-binding NtrC family response regulator
MIKLIAIILALVPQIIPAPAEMQVRDGVFTVSEKNQVKYVLDTKANIPAEGYTIDITRSRAKVVASTPAGLFYARQTIAQLEMAGPAGHDVIPGSTGNLMFWGTSKPMAAIRKTLDKIAPTDATVLITGENGTGKDVLAREIHAHSLRSGKPMVAVDAGAITETLFESELFGHVKGAFTDAHTDHVGKFEQADGGTLFLDEIGNIPLHLQAKLLRAIQNRSIVRVGGNDARPINIRLICATNMDLEQLVREGRFREDLYYRINTVHIALPALRERKEDIVPLAQLFLERFAEKYHRPLSGIAPEAAAMLTEGQWSGNIRELQNCIEKAVILSEGSELTAKDFQLEQAAKPVGTTIKAVSEAEEERMIRQAMDRTDGNISAAAKMLGVSRPTLYAKLKKYGL